jgi:hypothetical protein
VSGPAVVVEEIPDRQRAALAWRLRDLLAEADQQAAAQARGEHSLFAEMVRAEYLRGELLGLVSELEGGRRLVVVRPDGAGA